MKTIDDRAMPATPAVPAWLVWAVALTLVVGGLGSFGILDNNEGLYAEIPREMLASGDWRQWVIPHLNGLPYMEKPPLLYWLTAMSFAVFGASEWSARLVPAAASLSTVAMLMWFGTALQRPQAGRLAALMFASGVGVTAMSHVLMFDMLLTSLLTAALMLAYRYLQTGKAYCLRYAYLFLAFAVLAKGFVALILFCLVVVTFDLVRSHSLQDFLRALRKWFEPWALLAFLAAAAPWHIAASLTEPVFAWFYFINEHVLRFLGKREPHDYYSGGWWYYLPRMAIYLFPWSFVLLGVVASRRDRARAEDVALKRFLPIAWLMPLLFFSVSSAKANYYLVAVMPFAAFHLAVLLEERAYLRPWARTIPGLAIAALGLVVCFILAKRGGLSGPALLIAGMEQQQFALAFVAGLALLALLAAASAWRSSRIGIVAYLLLPIWTSFGLAAILQAMEPLVSTRPMAAFIQRQLPGRTIYLFRNFEEQSSLPFYLKHPVPIVDARSNDLFWGNKLRRNEIILDTQQFSAIAAQPSTAIVVMQRQLPDFLAAGLAGQFAQQRKIGETTLFYH
jgi:4-amino-4-deoxy-L-arabinose transferase-like glycosyltransferase